MSAELPVAAAQEHHAILRSSSFRCQTRSVPESSSLQIECYSCSAVGGEKGKGGDGRVWMVVLFELNCKSQVKGCGPANAIGAATTTTTTTTTERSMMMMRSWQKALTQSRTSSLARFVLGFSVLLFTLLPPALPSFCADTLSQRCGGNTATCSIPILSRMAFGTWSRHVSDERKCQMAAEGKVRRPRQ